MASAGGGAIRNKRGHSTSKPYERKKSLFRRLTDSFKDVFNPSWLQLRTEKNDASRATEHEDIAASSDEHEDVFVSPVQSPSQLPGQSQFSKNVQVIGDTLLDKQSSPVAKECIASVTNTLSTAGLWQTPFHESVQGNSQISMTPHFQRDSLSGMFPSLHQQKNPSSWHIGGSVSETRNISKLTATPTAGAATPIHKILLTSDSKTNQPRLATLPLTQSRSDPVVSEGSFLRCNESLAVSAGVSISTPSSPSALGGESAAKRQRLWCPESSRRGSSLQAALSETPSFKVSVFCSPNLNDSVHESSFYAGKTTFGGASAYSRRNLNTSVYQTSLPIRKSVKPKPLNTSGNAVLSSSATQILKTLERLSSAKKTGSNAVESDSLLSFTPSSYRKTPRLSTNLPSRSLELPLRGPPTCKIPLLTSACIAKNRQAANVSSMLTRRAQHSVSTSEGDDVEEASERQRQGETSENVFGGLSSDSGSRKMRRTKTYEMHQKIQKDDDVPAEVPNLRTDFTLPVGAMPSFNFGPPYSTPASSNVLSSTSTPITAKKTNAVSPPLQFTFSSPIQKSEPGGSPAGATPERFQFSTPLKVAQSLSPSLDKSSAGKQLNCPSSSSGSVSTFGSINTAPKAKSFSVDAVPKMASASGMFETATSSGFGSIKAASQLKQGSVMDILGASGTSNSSMASASGFGGPIKPASQLSSGSVMDVLGGGMIEASAAASPASSGVQAVSKSKQETVVAEEKKDLGSQSKDGEDLMAKFRPPPGAWECETCLIQNDSKAIKCAACDTAKAGFSASAPGSKSGASSSGPTGNTDSLFAKFAPSPGTWECDACMLSNKAEATQCVACETPKLGAASAAPSSQTDLFAKFRKPADSWECDICSVQNKGSSNKCIACEASRPGTFSPGFSAGNTQPTSSSVVAAIGHSGGITFSFGSSAASTSSPFLTGGSTNKDSSSTSSVFTALGNSSRESGITFGAAGTSSSTANTGFKFGGTAATVSSGTAVPFGTGFKFSSNTSASPSADKDSTADIKISFTDSSNNAGSSTPLAGGFSPAVSAHASNGTQPPANLNFTFGVSSTGSSTAPSGSSAACSLLSPTFSGSAGGSALESQTTLLSSATAAQGSIEGEKVNFSKSAKEEDSVLASPITSFTPLFGQPANSFAVGAGQSSAAAESVTSHAGFRFGVPMKTEGAGSSGFGAKTGSQGSEHPLPTNNRIFDQNKSATTSGFGVQQPAGSNNGAASELDQFTAPSTPASDSKEPSGLTFSPIPSGFVLGPSSTSATITPSFSFGLPSQVTRSSGLASGVSSQQVPKLDFSGNKPTVNGEAWDTSEGFKFGQSSHSSTSGFTFGMPPPKGENPVMQAKPALGFSFDANAVSKTESSKRGLDKDEGPMKKKKVLDFGTGSSGAVEPFKQSNANPTTASTTSNVFKFGQSSEEKPLVLGTGFQFSTVSQDGAFSFNTSHGNASGSTGPVFGAGVAAGGVGSGNVAFGSAANATMQNSGGAAASFGGNIRPFSFNPGATPSFNFGANSSTPSAPVFQFGQAAESGTASTQSSAAVFMFGQNSQPGNGQSSFGPGGPQRMIKRAHRRTRK